MHYLMLLYITTNVIAIFVTLLELPAQYAKQGLCSCWASVRLSVCSIGRRTPPLLQVCCCGPGGLEITIDCCSSDRRMRAVPRQRT